MIVLTDEADGTVSCVVTHHPTLTEHEVSGAAQYALTFASLMRIANLHDNRPPRFTLLRHEPEAFAAPGSDQRHALATLIGYAKRAGRGEELVRFVIAMHAEGTVPSMQMTDWSTAQLREALSRFQQCHFPEAPTSAVPGAEPGQPTK